jgi:hypothetical protein
MVIKSNCEGDPERQQESGQHSLKTSSGTGTRVEHLKSTLQFNRYPCI